ncbi:hypothetical protein RAH32_00455 [Paracoccus sp. WLY502]|uniref:hypothetical protein n=1 Tax=Paracoccus yibinensis TaxID=3068891 RepID=UPI002796D773|nr:hypothetical protein [Paracoccus sp. WLY502]MDQ1898917.1 hypothetical protein [Paracoccus sp. WLY502]
MKHVLTLTCAAFLAACSTDTESYPRLLPTDQILAEPLLPDHAPQATSTDLEAETQARADALRQRADALRGPVIEPAALERIRPQG